MRQGRQYGLSAAQKADIWRRWKAGESLHEIGRACSKDHGSIQFLLSQHGGIAPAIRHRSQRTLTLGEREDISRGIASGLSIREIAQRLATGGIDGKPGGRTARRAAGVSSQRGRPSGLEVGSATQGLHACQAQEAADDRRQ